MNEEFNAADAEDTADTAPAVAGEGSEDDTENEE